jgi:putative PIN family toxin of toxin-antitoxin system
LPALTAVLDTNVLVSGIAYPASIPGKILSAWRRGAVTVFLSNHIIEELSRSLPRMNHRLNWPPQKFEEEVELLALQARIIEPAGLLDMAVRDSGDVPVLGTLLASRADYLITGDQDLLALADQYPSIVTPADFWRRHGS